VIRYLCNISDTRHLANVLAHSCFLTSAITLLIRHQVSRTSISQRCPGTPVTRKLSISTQSQTWPVLFAARHLGSLRYHRSLTRAHCDMVIKVEGALGTAGKSAGNNDLGDKSRRSQGLFKARYRNYRTQACRECIFQRHQRQRSRRRELQDAEALSLSHGEAERRAEENQSRTTREQEDLQRDRAAPARAWALAILGRPHQYSCVRCSDSGNAEVTSTVSEEPDGNQPWRASIPLPNGAAPRATRLDLRSALRRPPITHGHSP